MNKIFYIITKNLKQLTRSKTSTSVIFLGPLLLVLIMGFSFSTSNKYAIEIGIYTVEPTNLTSQVVETIKSDQYNLIKYESRSECIDAVKNNKIDVCLEFPKGFDYHNDTTNQIVVYVDFTKINLVYLLIDTISTKISEKSSEISTRLTQSLLERIKLTSDLLTPLSPKIDILVNNEKIVSQKRDEIHSGIEGMKLEYAAFDISEISSESANAINSLNSLNSELRNNLESIKTRAKELENILGENSSEGAKAKAIKERAEDSLNALGKNYNSTSQQLDAINEYINSIKSELEVTKMNLKLAMATREEVLAKLETIKGLVGTSKIYLEEANNAIKKIVESVNSIEIKEAEDILSPIKTKIEPVKIEKSHYSAIFPTLIVMIIMITGLLFSSTLIVSEKKSRAFFRNFITPTKNFTFDMAYYLTGLLIILAQLIIFILISMIFFRVSISDFFTTILLLLVAISFFIFLGMFIGYFFHSEETNILASISAVAIMLFFSSTVLPIESMPSYVQSIARLNPFVIAELLIRQSVFFDFSFSQLKNQFLLFILYVLVIFGLMVFTRTKLVNLARIKVPKITLWTNIKDLFRK